jgi:GNAT superfamily N-acetyltransferase
MTYYMTMTDDPDPEEWQTVDQGLSAYNDQFAPPVEWQRLAIFLRREDGSLAGGLLGASYWGWLYVETLWLEEAARGQDWGTRLLAEAEAEALRRDCPHVHLDTMSFQALPFYQKHGYTVWGTLEHFVAGHHRYYLRKDL